MLDYQHVANAALMVAQVQHPEAGPDQLSLIAAMQTQQTTSQTDQQLLPLLQQATQVVQSKQPPPPSDPAVEATFKAAMAEIQRKTQADQANAQLKAQELQQAAALKEKELQMTPILDQMQKEHDAQLEVLRMQREDEQKQFAEMMANQRNEADNFQKQVTELLKNKDDNDTALLLEQMKQQLASMQDVVAQAVSGREQTEQAVDTTPIMAQLQETLKHSIEAQKNDDHRAAIMGIMQSIQGLHEHLAKPKMIIKGPDGKPIGIGPQT